MNEVEGQGRGRKLDLVLWCEDVITDGVESPKKEAFAHTVVDTPLGEWATQVDITVGHGLAD